MSLDVPRSDGEQVKPTLLNVGPENQGRDYALHRPSLPRRRSSNINVDHDCESTSLSAPVRPLSPDTVSNLSADEYEQLRPSDWIDNLSSHSLPVPSQTAWRSKANQFWIRNKGVSFVVISQAFGALMNVATRLLEIEGNKGKGMHPFQILFVRMGLTCILSTFYMWWNKTPDFPFGIPEIRWLLVIRGLAGFFGVFGMFFSLLYLPLADATVITFLAPALACWACSILINEPFTRVEQYASLVSLLGVVIIARPVALFAGISNGSAPGADAVDGMPSNNSTTSTASDASSYENVTPVQRLTAVGVALIGVLGSATVYTIIRWIGKRAHPLITVNYYAAWVTFVSAVAQFALPEVGWVIPSDWKDWGLLTFLGVCGFTMQFLLAAGLAYEKSSRATNMAYTSMLFALFFDKVIFNHTPDMMSIIGSSLITGSAITTALQKDATKAPLGGTEAERSNDESRTGLISGMRDVEAAEDHDRLPVEEVQLRTWRKARGLRTGRS